MTLSLKELKAECMKKPGLWDDFLKAGKLDLLTMTVDIPKDEFCRINEKHFGKGALGAVIREVIKPVVKAIDHLAGTNLKECPGCALRELKLNNL